MNRNVWTLVVSQALALSAVPLVVLVGGLVGSDLAPSPGLVTLPVALLVVGRACATVPMPLVMRRYGRKPVFVGVALAASAVALLAAWFLARGSFWGFCFSVVLLGVSQATVQQYRFAAMESVAADQVGIAASRVLLGGLVAALLGPQLSIWGGGIGKVHFSGAFTLLAGLYVLSAAALTVGFREPVARDVSSVVGGRPWRLLLNQRVLWAAMASAAVGYAVMSFIMTATPLSMHVQAGHNLIDTKRVIQVHILAMFLPSLFSGRLAAYLGLRRLIYLGVLSMVVCVAVGETGQGLASYWVALAFLGVGWNFLFVGGTALLPQAYRPEERFRVQSLNEFVVFGTQAVAALSAGWAIEALGWYRFLVSTLPLIGLLGLVIWAWRRESRVAGVATD